MSQGNDFANYASSAEDRSSASEDVWFVAVSSDDIKQMNVDQLDEAFRLGVITAQTAVWTEGMEAWAPLGEVADLDGSEEETSGEVPAAPAAFSAPESFASSDAFASPTPFSAPSAGADSVGQRGAQSSWHNPFEAPASAAPTGFGREQTLHSAVHEATGPSSFSPASASSYAPATSSFAPVTSSFAPSASGSLAHSTGPVALNVDEDMPPVNRGRRFRPERWLLAAAGVVAVAVIGFNNKDLFSSASTSVAAAEKQASAAALIARPYEAPADKESASATGGTTAPAAVKSTPAPDDADAPIGSLKGEKAEDEESSEEESATGAAASSKALERGSVKDSSAKDKESLRGGMAKAFAKGAPAGKGAKAERAERLAKSGKAAKAKPRKTPSRAANKAKKGGVTRSSSAFDPLNGSLP